jgi:F-type H+-transporting ATPase subunit delta
MSSVTSGEFYARAVLELALEKSELERWRVGLSKIADIAADEELTALLENSALSLDAKKGLLEKRLGEINPLALDLACLLASKGQLKIAGHISQEYERLLDAHYGIEHAEFVTALPLDEGDKRRYSRQLEKMIGRKFGVDSRVDPAILGGLIIKIGDMLIDRSLRSRLEALRKELIKAGR